MSVDSFLIESLAVLGTAVGMVFLCARLRVPSVIGLIVTGFVIGPFGFALVKGVEHVEVFAEIGVVLLLFLIGMEVNLGELKRLRRPFLVGGATQALLTTAVASGLALLWAPGPREALFAGMVVALSSTAVVLKLYDEGHETRAPQGRATLGVLLFQDFLIVPFIVLVPMLAGQAEASLRTLLLRFGFALGAITLVVAVGWLLMPRVLHLVVRARVRELFVMTGLVTCLALAWFTHSLGLSMALGAFLAGILVSESEYSHQLVADVMPFRDVFASIFFVSIGMLVDLRFAAANLGLLAGLAALVILVKIIGATIAVRLVGYPIRVALISGLGLAQIGEFSFVLMEVGSEFGLLTGRGFQTLLSVAVLTLLTTPLLIRAAPALAQALSRPFGGGEVEPASEDEGDLSGHVIVLGMGENGRLLSKVLSEAHISHIGIDLDPQVVERAREQGMPARYGDAGRHEILERAGIERAQVVVVTLSDPRTVLRVLRLARQENPDAALLVTTPYEREIPSLRAAGANEVISEEFEAAIATFTRVLTHYHVPANVIRAQSRVLRGGDYRLLRDSGGSEGVSEAVLEVLEQGTVDLYRLAETSRAVGCSLRDLDLRRDSGASVIAIVRARESIQNPSPDLELKAGDQLVLVGSHQEIERAFDFLDQQDSRT